MPGTPHLARLEYLDGFRTIFGSDLGLNLSSAMRLADDKLATKEVLAAHGFGVLDGIRVPQSCSDVDARQRIPFELPWCVKPVHGRFGTGVRRCADVSSALRHVERLRAEHAGPIMIEPWVAAREYRVVVADDEVVLAYRRSMPVIVGDGTHTARWLLAQLDHAPGQAQENASHHYTALAATGIRPEEVVAEGLAIPLAETANMSTGATATDVLGRLHPTFVRRCREVASVLGLSYCGIDLAIDDIGDPASRYFIYEVNAAPSVLHFHASGDGAATQVERMLIDLVGKGAHSIE